ncbi:uncharacterized protein RJT21DRAFT_120423 [Scheffersomyces amazonensis]|uniref:uncharacterized protein n=1 Tax=Scheffersomyces amazonensis TaxID=1078765 RepID=UPI00315D1E3B
MTDTELEDDVVEFDFPLPIKLNQNPNQIHTKIRQLLQLSDDDEDLNFIFTTTASLCDPFTQPEENESYILSVDLVGDLLIGLTYSKYVNDKRDELPQEIESIKFDLSTKYFILLKHIHTILNAIDELDLRYLDNSEDNFQDNIKFWTPHPELANDEFNLKIVYSMACVLIMSIYKLFKPSKGIYNLALNPYLQYFLKLWKCHTNITLLGLQIDRRIEDNNDQNPESLEETPEIIKQVLKGTSSIRYVLAWVLNQNPSSWYDEDLDVVVPRDDNKDLTKETLLNFIHPLGRRIVNGGSLSIDMRLIIIALLILNVGVTFVSGQFSETDKSSRTEEEATRRFNQSTMILELGDILIDLEYDDRFDEDVRYMFENEYDEDDAVDEWEEDEEDVQLQNDDIQDTQDKSLSRAIRSTESSTTIDFDENGRDWRDLARGENTKYSAWFIKKLREYDVLKNKNDSDDFFDSETELIESFDFLTVSSIEGDSEVEKRLGQIVLNTIAKAIKDEQDGKKEGVISPDAIYQYWSSPASEKAVGLTQENNKLIVPIFSITNFELLLQNNNKLARCMMDEMLMCSGYRRVLIWFLTHNINLSALLIDYVFELSSGLRGQNNKQVPYLFTRCGDSLVISEVEQSMLLHEFLTNCSVYLSATDGIEIDDGYKVVLAESIAKKYLSLLCLMITRLISIGIINLDVPQNEDSIDDYSNELRVLLINWVGKLPAARELFFKVQNSSARASEQKAVNSSTSTSANTSVDYSMEDVIGLFKTYDAMDAIEITHDMASNTNHREIIQFYTDRLSGSIESSISFGIVTAPKVSLQDISQDFEFFFTNFNVLCKIDTMASILFKRFESFVTSGTLEVEAQHEPTLIEDKEEENVDAEFNANFLNGSGHFDESQANPKKKGKKKKKTKRK